MTTQPVKRGRGRPKIYANTERNVLGICNAPSGDPNHGDNIAFELIYDNANELKKLASLMARMKSENIQIHILPDAVSFLTLDSKKNMQLYFSIDCAKVNRYYAAQEILVTLNAVNFCKIINSLSVPGKKPSSFKSIAFICRQNEIHQGITIISKQNGGTISSDTIHVSNIEPFPAWNTVREDIANLDKYSVKATISMDLFKSLVIKAQRLSRTIRFEKVGDDPLACHHTFRSNWGSNVSQIMHGVSGNVIIHDGRVLMVSICAEYLKALTKLTLCDTVTLHLDNEFPIILSCTLSIFNVKMIIKVCDDKN